MSPADDQEDSFIGTFRHPLLDPACPAAQSGVQVGDRILGSFPSRMNPRRVAEQVATPYRFGLDRIATGAKVANLDVTRDAREFTYGIKPRLIPGGFRVAYRASGDATAPFFRWDSPQGGR
ncbi:MAG TPA: hypothetical protein VKF62_03520 [Planctomycetota bacterium]|nr:hypothetical protein [Planctomycetota bacterium]